MNPILFAQSVSPESSVQKLAESGVLGALIIVLVFACGYLLRLLLKAQNDRIDDKDKTGEKLYSTLDNVKDVLEKVREDYRERSK